jgi:hypothetical protein
MRDQDKILKHLSLIKFKDLRVIQAIAYHPLLFAKHKMADPDDYRPIRIRYLGAFVQKYMHNKEMHKKSSYILTQVKLHPKLIKLFVDPDTGDPFFANITEFKRYIDNLFVESKKDDLNELYDAILKAIEDK